MFFYDNQSLTMYIVPFLVLVNMIVFRSMNEQYHIGILLDGT